MAIYVNFKKPRTINEFLLMFYTQRNNNTHQSTAAITYFNNKCTIVQCDKIRRSFDDLLELVQTYYPSTTPKILIGKLLKLKIPEYNSIMLTNCGGMKRIRISYFAHSSYKTNYDNAIGINKLDSKYSWKDLLDMIGIMNEQQYENYINN
jgi:hypothetical protein